MSTLRKAILVCPSDHKLQQCLSYNLIHALVVWVTHCYVYWLNDG